MRPVISPLATASTRRAASRRASCNLRSAAALSRARKACGRFLPKLFRNDAQMRGLSPVPLTARVDTRHLAARLRIAYFADAVPNDDAAINLVADHSGGSLRRSVNGRGVPGAAA